MLWWLYKPLELEGNVPCVLLEWDDSVGPFLRSEDAARVLEDQERVLTRVMVECDGEYPLHQVIPMPERNDGNGVIFNRSAEK